MNRILFVSITLFILVVFPLITCAYPILEIPLPDIDSSCRLIQNGYDIIAIEEEVAYIKGWSRDLERLPADGFNYHVFIEDYPAYTRDRFTDSLDDMGGYMTLDEIYQWIESLIENYPSIVSQQDTIGYSYEDRPIILFKISDNPNTNETDETEVYLNAAIHADEVAGPYILHHFCEYLTGNYRTDERVFDLVNNHEIWIQMVCNPDSYYMNGVEHPGGGGGYRHNQRPPVGVDLNRNWPIMWEYGCNDENRGGYHGEIPGSESEVEAMMSFINEHDFSAIMNYHACGNQLHIPWGYTVTEHPDYATYMAYANYINETLGYSIGGPQLMYLIYGGARDWQASYCIEDGIGQHIWSMLFEVGFISEDGVFVGHWPSIGMAETYAEEHLEPLMRFIEFAEYPENQLPPQPVVPNISDTLSTTSYISWINPNEQDIQFDYEVYELDSLFLIDDASYLDTVAWTFKGIEWGYTDEYQGISYYHDIYDIYENSMTTRFPYLVQENDTLCFSIKYIIEIDRYSAHVQISTDGLNFSNLEGNITDNLEFGDIGSYNRGHRIQGNSVDWIGATFPLEDYIGEYVFFRIILFGYPYNENQGIFVDNISPVLRYQNSTVVSTSTQDSFVTLNYSQLEYPVEKNLSILTNNPINNSTCFSRVVTTIIDPEYCELKKPSFIPELFSVSDVYPNPFNPSTTVKVTVPDRSNLTIVLHDILGREVKTVMHSAVETGVYNYSVDASDLASGLYFLVVNAHGEKGTNHRAVKKAILMK